jgi:hypothetical protein
LLLFFKKEESSFRKALLFEKPSKNFVIAHLGTSYGSFGARVGVARTPNLQKFLVLFCKRELLSFSCA